MIKKEEEKKKKKKDNVTLWYNKFGFDNTHTHKYTHTHTHTHTHTYKKKQKNNNSKTILIEKSGSNDNNNNRKVQECHNHDPQPTPDTKRKRKRTKINTCNCLLFCVFFFFLCVCVFFFVAFFQHIKISRAFYTGKIAKKWKKKNAFCLWHMRNQFTVHSELQPYLTGSNHPYTRQVKCPLIWDLIVVLYVLCTHLPSFGRAIGWTMKYE